MSQTLNLPEELLVLAQLYLHCGRDQKALHVLGKLAELRDLPAALAEETHVSLAEVYLRHRKYKRARRHVTQAMALHPGCARYHYLLAMAVDQDERVDGRRALRHYRRAVELNPDEPAYLSDYGQCLIAHGRTDEGLRFLERAVDQAPCDVSHLRALAMHLLEIGQAEQARRAVQTAIFRNPRDADFKKLWHDLRFIEVQRTQGEIGSDGASLVASGPVLLPFVRKKPAVIRSRRMSNGDIARMDSPSAPHGPHFPRPVRRRQSH